MALWITQHLDLPGQRRITLSSDRIYICTDLGEGYESDTAIDIYPRTRQEANTCAIAFKLAAKRLEEMGKRLPNV